MVVSRGRVAGVVFAVVVAALMAHAGGAIAGEADVVGVEINRMSGGSYRVSVAVRHADTGWEHYADKWDVLAPDGRVLGTRVLVHPHEDEQPFTRSLSGLRIPAGIATVTVRAHDKVHLYGGRTMTVAVPR
jgi:hypothetical protein